MRLTKLSTICLTISLAIVIMLLAAGCTAPATPTPTAKAGAPVKLVFTTQPGGAASASALSTQPVVTIQDANGSTVTTSILPVTLSVTPGTGTRGAMLFGATKINATNGVAKFSNISIDKAGTAYTLTASSGSLTPAISAPFTIASGAAEKLEFTVQPSVSKAGSPLPSPPEVIVADIYGNRIPDYQGPVRLIVTPGSGPSSGILAGTTTVNAVNGLARFTDVSISRSWNAFTLTASSGALASATSIVFAITPIEASKLEVTVHPAGAKAGSPFEEQPIVAVEDIHGNVITSSTVPITIAITPGTGASGAVLSGAKTLDADVGLARYEDLAINLPGTGYTLTATSSGLTSAASQPFNVAAKQ